MHRSARLQIAPRLLFAAVVSAAAVFSQVESPSARSGFEVASVKPTASTDGRTLLQAVPGRLIMTNLALRRLVLIAYGVQDYQLSGDPPWINSAHYDIQAKADGNTSVQQMEGPMLQVLLEERFKLKVHRETRPLPIYVLAVGKGGAKLQPSKEGGCTTYSLDSPPPVSTPGEPRPTFCGFRQAPADGLNRMLDGKGVTMAMLATSLSRTYNLMLGRNVIDGTGLTGRFDVQLKWAFNPMASLADFGTPPVADSTGPSIFTALQEQLGLKLESARGPVEVLVIDHIEKLSVN
jgi:uncharacterized protein (TIGR03435 family)